ncbi:hypothetical protein LBMAG53_01610 [Planctomycetota bacterium]|nr:hypothetical protein LBMAG53_01610 [Planctomycetota bacterium]
MIRMISLLLCSLVFGGEPAPATRVAVQAPAVPAPPTAVPASPAMPMAPAVRQAVDRGLAYLVQVQQPDGTFPAKWDAKSYPATMTALAGLALLASGSTPQEGPYAAPLRQGMQWLIRRSETHPDGLIAGEDEQRCTYGHGFAMLFLAQCAGMELTKDDAPRVRRALERAIALVARGQSPQGGWLYSPLQYADEGSTTACVLQGLRACRNVGIKVPAETIDRAAGYLRLTQNPDGGIAYSAVHRGASRPALAAAALACWASLGHYDRKAGGDGPEADSVARLWRYLKTAAKDEDVKGHYFYHHFYLSQATWVLGGKDWDDYLKAMSRDLLARQAANGTWAGDDVGPTYGTAIACLILQLPLGHLPFAQR